MIGSYNFNTKAMRVLIYIFLGILLVITILPIWLLLVNATRSTVQIQQGISILPSTHTFENYDIITGRGMDLLRGFWNSLLIAVTSTLLTVYIAFMAAYGAVVYNFPGKRFFSGFVVVLVLVPLQLSIIGFFQYMSRLGLTDNYLSLILPAAASAFAVFFGIQYFRSVVVKDLIDAGRVDGAGEFRIFNRVMMPLAMPGAVTLAIFSFIAAWNAFFNPFILISTREKYTLPMLIQTLRGDMYRTEYGSIYLALAITIVPVIIMYIFLSRYIINGIAMGSVKE